MNELANGWLAAVNDERIAGELEAIYQLAADAIEARGPACWASGRCCNFREAGHRLYVTGLETAYTISRLPTTAIAKTESQGQGVLGGVLTAEALATAIARGGCAFQIANLCGVHTIKPLACRVYFCDRSAQDWQHELSERLIAMVKSLHDLHGLEYRYGEWGGMLEEFLTQG